MEKATVHIARIRRGVALAATLPVDVNAYSYVPRFTGRSSWLVPIARLTLRIARMKSEGFPQRPGSGTGPRSYDKTS